MLESPYATGTDWEWLTGNLNTDSTETRGELPPDALLEEYERRGYDFLGIADHDVLVDPDEYRESTSLLLVPTVEVTANGPDVLHVNADRAVDPSHDRQEVLEEIRAAGGFAVLSHPKWGTDFDHWPQEELTRLEGYSGLEIYNGVIERLNGAAVATDRWDRLLGDGNRVWGFAVDDAHRVEDVGRGWVAVQATERTPEAVCDALEAGRFYASTGVTISEIDVIEDAVTIATEEATRIRLIGDYGVVQSTADGPKATFRVPEDLTYLEDPWINHTYVRIECLGETGEMAWTQPLALSGLD